MNTAVRRTRGQALVESVLIIPVVVILVSGIFFFARVSLTKQQLVVAARYGTDLIACTNMDENGIRQELTAYLCGEGTRGRRLDADRLRFTIRKDLFPEIDSLTDLAELEDACDRFFKPLEHTSYVEIYYDFRVPPILSAWSRFLPGRPLPDRLTVGARSEVLAGTGSGP